MADLDQGALSQLPVPSVPWRWLLLKIKSCSTQKGKNPFHHSMYSVGHGKQIRETEMMGTQFDCPKRMTTGGGLKSSLTGNKDYLSFTTCLFNFWGSFGRSCLHWNTAANNSTQIIHSTQQPQCFHHCFSGGGQGPATTPASITPALWSVAKL